MEIKKSINLTDFEFWAGAKNHYFTYDELEELDYIFEDLFADKLATDTDINDLFWFEKEFLCELLRVNYSEYLNR